MTNKKTSGDAFSENEAEQKKLLNKILKENQRLDQLVGSYRTEAEKCSIELHEVKQELERTLEQYHLTEYLRITAETELLDLKSEIKKLRVKLADLDQAQ